MREHFANITIEEFEKNLERAGIEVIHPAADDGYEMVFEEDVVTNYNASKKPVYAHKVTEFGSSECERVSYDNTRLMGLAA
jgi:hypothetical protein